jgi:hypothetical protein
MDNYFYWGTEHSLTDQEYAFPSFSSIVRELPYSNLEPKYCEIQFFKDWQFDFKYQSQLTESSYL